MWGVEKSRRGLRTGAKAHPKCSASSKWLHLKAPDVLVVRVVCERCSGGTTEFVLWGEQRIVHPGKKTRRQEVKLIGNFK